VIRYLLSFFLLFFVASCGQEDPRYLGEEEACNNGYFFSLKDLACQAIDGFFLDSDEFSQQWLQTRDDIRVPSVINGRSPFMVGFYYDVDQDNTKFEIAVRRIENGNFHHYSFSDWKEVYLDKGSGWHYVRISIPKDRPLKTGRAINRVQGHWLQRDGWLVEVKGGDPNEGNYRNKPPTWRAAGLQVDPEASDQLAAKSLILGSIEAPSKVYACSRISGQFELIKLDFDLTAIIALKQPGLNWQDWGGVSLEIPALTAGNIPFSFVAVNNEGDCPPPAGPASRSAAGLYFGNGYLLQMDLFDESGKRLELNAWDFSYVSDHLLLQVSASEDIP